MNSADPHLDTAAAMDFARGLTPQDERWGLEQHLRCCSECACLVEVFQKLYSVTRSMDKTLVPENWTRVADDLFISKMLGSEPSLPVRLAELICDSFYHPFPAELRAEVSGRLVSYFSEDCSIDLQIDASADSEDTMIVGQIGVGGSSSDELAGKPIIALHGRRLLARTTFTRFGEFKLTFSCHRNIRLAFCLRSQQIDVPLNLKFTAE